MSENKNENTLNVPKHVAIIPDGNRRWAREKGLEPWRGHEVAAENLEDIIYRAGDLGVTHLTLWGSSRENLEKRPLAEKKALLEIYAKNFSKLIESERVKNGEVRIRVIGRWEEAFPGTLKKILKRGIESTKNNTAFHLTLCLAYSGDDEMVEAVKKLVSNCESPDEVTSETLKENLMTHDLPSVDYLIRTGGEPHLSVGFMMWEIANAQLYFTDLLCPDFDASAFAQAIEEFGERARRHGA